MDADVRQLITNQTVSKSSSCSPAVIRGTFHHLTSNCNTPIWITTEYKAWQSTSKPVAATISLWSRSIQSMKIACGITPLGSLSNQNRWRCIGSNEMPEDCNRLWKRDIERRLRTPTKTSSRPKKENQRRKQQSLRRWNSLVWNCSQVALSIFSW